MCANQQFLKFEFICFLRSCHAEERYKNKFQMHPLTNERNGEINHTGDMILNKKKCRCGAICKRCGYCGGCSCKCHQSFSLRFRFMSIEIEEKLVQDIQSIIGSNEIYFAVETSKRLDFFRPLQHN